MGANQGGIQTQSHKTACLKQGREMKQMGRRKANLEQAVMGVADRKNSKITQCAIMSELEANRPKWHTTMVKTENHLRNAVFSLMGTIR